jgi:molecular chaperone DnaJ
MTEDLNPYAVLRVSSHATLADINHAFRARLRALHPDTRHPESGGTASDTKLQQLIAAYHLLRDAQDRAQHDRNAGAATAPPPQRRPRPSGSFPVSASPDGPVTIPVTHRASRAPAARGPLWAGPVRRHR